MSRQKKPVPAAPHKSHTASTLSQLREGEQGVLDRLELSLDEAQRMMELGFVPGARVTAARSAPGGDPRVYRVDGSEIAMRRETASCMKLRLPISVRTAP